MRRIVVSCLLFLAAGLAALPAWAGVDLWTPIGPDGGEITALEAHPVRDNVVFAGTRGGVFKSTDRGASWRLASRGLQNRPISAIAVAPSNGNLVYAASFGNIFVSQDSGETWRLTARPIADQTVTALGVDPRDPRQVWAATERGVFRSRNGGATWPDATTPPLERVVDLAVAPDGTVYVANLAASRNGSGIFKTPDGGATWVQLDAGQERASLSEQMRVAADPVTPGLVYASFGLTSAVDQEATYRSTDSGATWQKVEGGYPVAVNRAGGVYAGSMRSADHGQTWTFIASLPGNEVRDYAASAAGGLVWAATLDDGIARRLDSSNRWESSSRGLHATYVTSLAINPKRPRVLYSTAFTVSGIQAFKTENGGASWKALFVPEYSPGFFDFPLLALSPAEPARVYIAWKSPGGLLRTDNGAIFWEPLRGFSPTDHFYPTQILADPHDPGIVYLLGTDVGPPGTVCTLARSTDRGETFQCPAPFDSAAGGVDPFKDRLFADPARPGRLWLPVRRGLFWRSDDYGATWSEVRAAGLRNAGEPRALAFDPAVANRLYLGTEHTATTDRAERIWRSDDGGLTWTAWARNLPGSGVTEILIDPRQPGIQYALVDPFTDSSRPDQILSGVFWSRNGGRTWGPLFNGLPLTVVGLAMDPKNPDQLYALTHNLGIYAFTRQ